MGKYNYFEAVKEDLQNYILDSYGTLEEFANADEDEQQNLYDEAFISDYVTGNASGSYTFNEWKAEENICHNFYIYRKAMDEFGGKMPDSAEEADVKIRCYLLGQCMAEIISENK